MTALSFTVTDAGRAEIINANNTGTGPVTITHIALGSGQYPPAKAQTSLQQEFKRLSVFGGEVVADDVIHVTITDDGPDQYTLGEFGLISDKGTLIALYAQTTPILEKNAEGIVLLSADMTLTSIDANSITFGPAEFVYPPASLTRAGVVVLSNAVNSTSQTQAATPQAVKTVNDALEDHKAASSAHTKGQVGLGLLQNWTYSHSYTGGSASKYATEKAVTDSHIYLKGYTDTAITNLVASSPAALDTLNELAAALGDDPNFATTMTNELAKKLNASSYTAADVLAKLKSVDGTGSGLDADLLHGQHGSYYRAWGNLTGVPATASRWPEIDEISNLSLELQRAQGLNVGGSAVDPNTTSDHVILSNHANTPGLGVYWHITTTFYSSKSSSANRAQLAIQYNGSSPCKVFARSCYNNTWLPWVRCDNGEYTAADVLAKLKTVDGAGSGLDADLFDGVQRADMEATLKAYTDTKVAGLVDAAPGTLDTLNELAAALGDDPNFATTMTNELAKKLNAASYTAADVLAKVKSVDGASSGLDADLLDGQHGDYYRAWANLTGVPATFPPSSHAHTWTSITGKPATFPPSSHSHPWSEITGKPELFTPTGESFSDGSGWAIIGSINTPIGIKPLIKQWGISAGSGNGTINYPITFPNAICSLVGGSLNDSAAGGETFALSGNGGNGSLPGLSSAIVTPYLGTDGSNHRIYWEAIGY